MPSKPSRARRVRDPSSSRAYPLRRKRSPEMTRIIESVSSLAWLAAQFTPPICKQAVSRWNKVPLDRVKELSEITGIPTYEIRPDVFEPPIFIERPRRRHAAG